MLTGIIVGVCFIFLGVLLNKKAMQKLGTAFSALLGKAADKALDSDRIAVYKNQIEKAANELKEAMNLLEEHAANIKQLKRKLEADKNERDQTEAWTKKLINEGNEEGAEKYAEILVNLEESIGKTTAKLERSETNYKGQGAKIKKLKEQIVEYKQKAGTLASDLQTSKAEARISELEQKFDSGSLGFDDIKETEEAIQKQIDKYESKATVAQDLAIEDPRLEMKKEMKNQKAKDVLDRLKAQTKQTT